MKTWNTASPEETRAAAAELAAACREGTVIRLHGDLGAGKTQWVKGFAAALGFTGEVTSPTFSLLHEYEGKGGTVHHWDLYRLEAKTDWEVLDLAEHLDGDGITVVEWPERYPGPWPDGVWDVRITMTGPEGRRIEAGQG